MPTEEDRAARDLPLTHVPAFMRVGDEHSSALKSGIVGGCDRWTSRWRKSEAARSSCFAVPGMLVPTAAHYLRFVFP